MKHTWILWVLTLASAAPSFADNNLHLIDSDPQTGFAIYRTGKPNLRDYQELCKLGIDQMIVLSGDAAKHELKFQSYCPGMKVIYNEQQKVRMPLTVSFLKQFDEWVANAKAQGKKIAFRCECGCHRTGRLAAYYQMKYQHLTADDAIAIMNAHGKWMFLHPILKPQVRALSEYIHGEACVERQDTCVRSTEPTLQEMLALGDDNDN